MSNMSKDKIVCPHCGHPHLDWHEYVDPTDMEGEFTIECENKDCGIEFRVEMKTDVWFTTARL